jgi:hypothetical protein
MVSVDANLCRLATGRAVKRAEKLEAAGPEGSRIIVSVAEAIGHDSQGTNGTRQEGRGEIGGEQEGTAEGEATQ